MLLQHSQHDALPPDSSQNLRNMAVLIAATAIVSTRSRVGGALALAGLAWLYSRPKAHVSRSVEVALAAHPLDSNEVTVKGGSTGEFCAPSDPFLDTELTVEEAAWEELRSSVGPQR